MHNKWCNKANDIDKITSGFIRHISPAGARGNLFIQLFIRHIKIHPKYGSLG